MKLVSALLAAILAIFSIGSAADIAHFTRQAKQLRKSKSHHTRTEKRRLVRLHRDTIRQIPRYREETMEASVAAMVRRALKSDAYTIVNSKETIFGGESKANVFFVYDKQGGMKYVVKAFPRPNYFDTGFLAELSGMALINERDLATVSTVFPIDIGICLHYKSEYGLLLETAAPGKRADQFIQEVMDTSQEDPKRKERLKMACHMCKAAGIGLSEFHGIDDQQRAALQRTGLLRAKLEFDLLLTPDIKKTLKEQIDLDALGSYMRKQIRNVLKMDSGKYFRHGDAGPKNIFYDHKSKRIYLIDVARVHHFINRAGHPQARGIDDLYLLHLKIVELAQKGLTKEEQLLLSEALCSGYTAIPGSDKAHVPSGHLYNVLAEISRCCALPDGERGSLQKNIEFLNTLIQAT